MKRDKFYWIVYFSYGFFFSILLDIACSPSIDPLSLRSTSFFHIFISFQLDQFAACTHHSFVIVLSLDRFP